MVTEVTMPKLGLTMQKGAVGKWFKKEGEKVEKGELLFEVETEKITKKIEAPASGVLRKIIVPEKGVVPVSALIGFIGGPDEPLPEIAPPVLEAPGAVPEKVPEVKEVAKPVVEIPKEIKISPIARKLAEEQGIDVTKIQGTGPGGRIVKEDVLRAVEEAKVAPPPVVVERVKVKPMSIIRKVVAERLSKSHLTAVHVTITTEVDMTETVKLRTSILQEIEKAAGVRVSYTDIIVKAVTKALKEYPIMNSTLEGDKIKISEDIHMGFAVALEEGLIVPVIRDADKKSLIEIALAAKELSEKAREGTISIDEAMGSTFTVTNLGMFGAEIFTPIINPPETAILGVGRIVEKPAVKDGQIVVRSMMLLSLSFDHRVVDGAPAAQFLQRVKQILENPYLLIV